MAAAGFVLFLALAGILTAAFMAGRSEKKKTLLLWGAGALLWTIMAEGVLFCMKSSLFKAILELTPMGKLVQTMPMTPEMEKAFAHIMILLGSIILLEGIIIFLWGFNCRKNSSKWYWALLWSAGIVLFLEHVLFLPLFYGGAAWMNLVRVQRQDFFNSTSTYLAAFYAMPALLLLSALLWTWHTLKTARHSWKNILTYAGCFTGFASLLWLSAWGVGSWAKKAADTKAAELGITPYRTAEEEPPELKALGDPAFYTRHAKYHPPRSGRYDWSKDAIPADEKEYTMKFFTSPEVEAHLACLKKSAACISRKNVLYFSPLRHFRSLVRHRADIAELYFRSAQEEKVLPELLKYPELESLIPADTPYLICELVRTATRAIWVDALVKYGPEEKSHLPTYRKLLDWSKNWKVHLPCEAGYYLTFPPEPKSKIAAFFYAPHLNTARYRGFSDAVNRIPKLKKLERQEVISEDGTFAAAAKKQRLGIVLGRTAIALKVYKIEHGKYPQKLGELVPRYLPGEYLSPSTGKKFSYTLERTAGGRRGGAKTGAGSSTGAENFILSTDGVTFTSKR